MSNLNKTTSELIKLKAKSETGLSSLVDNLEQKPDLLAATQRLMQSNDALEALKDISFENKEIARVVVDSGVAALLNAQAIKEIAEELKRRSGLN